MRYRNIVIALGFLTVLAASPVLGIPRSWKDLIIIFSGLAIATLAYLAGKARS